MAFLAPLLAAASLTGGGGHAADLPTIESPRVSSPVLVAGVVRDANGLPVAGPVSVSVMPRDVHAGDEYPVVAHGAADASGHFEARITDEATLDRIARRQHGWVETITTSDNAVSASAGLRTIRIWHRDGGRLAFTPRTIAARAEAAGAASAPHTTPTVDLRVAPSASNAAATAQSEHGSAVRTETRACSVTPLWKVKDRDTMSAWTIVGELNNAYSDGTTGTFSYGKEGSTDSSIGIAVATNGATFSISEETSISDSATIVFPEFSRRLARKMRTRFTVVKTVEERSCPNTKVTDRRTTIRAVSWDGGTDVAAKQPAALDRCRRVGGYDGGAEFTRDQGRAVRYNTGATAFGVTLTAQSGYSRNVVTQFHFGGKVGKKHYLCGADGITPATRSGRIYSGGEPS